MIRTASKKALRKKRLPRIRVVVKNSHGLPRLVVNKTNKRLAVALINDTKHITVFTLISSGKNIEAGKNIGSEAAKACLAKKIKRVVFDRSGFRYHGVVKAIADSMREGGVTI